MPELLQAAKRGLECKQNIEYQETINRKLEHAKAAVSKRELTTAIKLFEESIEICLDKITKTDDIVQANIKITPPSTLQQALDKLQQLQLAYEQRSAEQIRVLATKVVNNFKKPRTSEKDCHWIMHNLTSLLKGKWPHLDTLNMDSADVLSAKIEQTIKDYQAKHNFLVRPFRSSSHYIYHKNMLKSRLDEIISKNIPQGTNEPIVLDIFIPDQATLNTPMSVIFRRQEDLSTNPVSAKFEPKLETDYKSQGLSMA